MSKALSKAAQTDSLARELVDTLTSTAIFCLSLAPRHARRAWTRTMLRSLSDKQLRDAGIDRSLIHRGLVVEVDARLMSTLMSLR